MDDLLKGVRVIYQSAIRIERDNVIWFDPFELPQDSHDADIIFITHGHYDHFSPEDIEKVSKKDTKIVVPRTLEKQARKLGMAEVKGVVPGMRYACFGVRFDTVAAYNNLKPFHGKADGWVGYNLEIGGSKYYVAGDTDATRENRAVRCDVAFVPIGGTYTMNPREAAGLVNMIGPKVAVPTHYGCIVGDREDAKDFAEHLSEGIACESLMEFGE